jgi:uncharacterized membrane protein YGL010W
MVDSVFRLVNFCEGMLWIAIALALSVVWCRRRKETGLALTAALLFLAFGISDFVEMRTGGWYKPWWLFLWKAGCVVGFATVYILYRRRRHRLAVSNQ